MIIDGDRPQVDFYLCNLMKREIHVPESMQAQLFQLENRKVSIESHFFRPPWRRLTRIFTQMLHQYCLLRLQKRDFDPLKTLLSLLIATPSDNKEA